MRENPEFGSTWSTFEVNKHVETDRDYKTGHETFHFTLEYSLFWTECYRHKSTLRNGINYPHNFYLFHMQTATKSQLKVLHL